jgi:hypothetical protein
MVRRSGAARDDGPGGDATYSGAVSTVRAAALTAASPAAARRLVAIVGIGLLVGASTQVLQGILPGALNWLANSLSAWLIAAFACGARMPTARWAVAAGPPLLLAALAGYYALTLIRFGIGGGTATLAFWTLGSLAGGTVFGAAGWWWRHGGEWARPGAAGLLGALLAAEGIYLLRTVPDAAVGIGGIVAGLAVPLLLGRSWRDRALGEAAILPGLALGAAGYTVTLALYAVLTGVP